MNDDIIKYWCELFEKNKKDCLCLDIEMAEFNGSIAVVGLYRPREGLVECQQFVKGKNLTHGNLADALKGCKLLVTFSGKNFDVPMLNKRFSNVANGIPVFDLYLFAKLIGRGSSSLKTFENTFDINRLYSHSNKKGVALRRWRRYLKGDAEALDKLLEYNKQDTVNLYFLAEELVKEARKRITKTF